MMVDRIALFDAGPTFADEQGGSLTHSVYESKLLAEGEREMRARGRFPEHSS